MLISPESLGIVPSTVFILFTILFQLFFDSKDLLYYNSAILSVCFMIFLGFVDDVIELRWRYKLIIPMVAAIPLVVCYSGDTVLRVPLILQGLLGKTYDIGLLYYLYLSMLAIFCTNSINIYAGINGLEVGQSLVIGLTGVLWNLIGIVKGENIEGNTFSLSLLIPFVFSSYGLFVYNRYPSRAFIGDTYCYFAGMVLSAAAIIGSYPLMVLLFFIPQIINFLFSLPQLVGIIPCPRHRLPRFEKKTGLLYGKPENLNLLNIGLRLVGGQTEYNMCNTLLTFQVFCSAAAIAFRLTLFDYLF